MTNRTYLRNSVTAYFSLFVKPSKSAAAVVKLAAVLFFMVGLALPTCAFAQKWQDLKPDEQKVLSVLQPEWNSLSDVRKRKWREIAVKYPKMTPDQQKKLHDRMEGWVKLTPDERRKAREQYKQLTQLPPEKRAVVPQKWDEYRNLPPEKREELRKKAVTTKPVPVGSAAKSVTPPVKSTPPVVAPASTVAPNAPAPASDAKKP